jgi:hypothetical protein
MTIIFNDPNNGVQNLNITGNKAQKSSTEENYFFQNAEKITGTADKVANMVDDIPIVGGLYAAEAQLAGEIIALPSKVQGTGGIVAGSIVETQGNLVEGGYKLAGSGLNFMGDVAGKPAEIITGGADKLADMQEKIPVVGGLAAAQTRLAGEVLSLPSKAVSTAYHAAGSVANFIGETAGKAYDAVGGFLKKL